ncbi:stationary phase inducible protein CsiE [Mangrovibacter yixingensis]|uniref:stationary phase inducible protein CsiE n=1 Tax=Mangrovibacter yixingensis TaxID=1529639 RepID=UPI001CFE797A|nr:stationary phase inducible protein CsiE [Mangrovibacter yixingensis]
MTTTTPAPVKTVLTRQQRQCHLLLLLLLTEQHFTPELLSTINGTDLETLNNDIADTHEEIHACHRLVIRPNTEGHYIIEGTDLDKQLCLFHWLRRALRITPDFVEQQIIPRIKQTLKQQSIPRALYDETNLHALVSLSARRLSRQFSERDARFLRFWLLYSLHYHLADCLPEFNRLQREWIENRNEFSAACEIFGHLNRQLSAPVHGQHSHMLGFVFSLLKTPDPDSTANQHEKQLHFSIRRMTHDFRTQTGLHFSDEEGLHRQLYIHLFQALERVVLGIGIETSLPEEIVRLYPRLIGTTQQVLQPLSGHYQLHFSAQETGLIAVIFGAWLMQADALHEKQVLLLTGDNPPREKELEKQVRELTLLPLNIQYQTVQAFHHEGTPADIDLVISPYETHFPLVSPPLIHAVEPLTLHQQQRIRTILEG